MKAALIIASLAASAMAVPSAPRGGEGFRVSTRADVGSESTTSPPPRGCDCSKAHMYTSHEYNRCPIGYELPATLMSTKECSQADCSIQQYYYKCGCDPSYSICKSPSTPDNAASGKDSVNTATDMQNQNQTSPGGEDGGVEPCRLQLEALRDCMGTGRKITPECAEARKDILECWVLNRQDV
jgi:hypothetical protein